MAWCDRGAQTLLAAAGAFAAFSLMTVAIGTDYWLYSRAYICNATNASADENQMQTRKVRGDLTHSGLWRVCCVEGTSERSRALDHRTVPHQSKGRNISSQGQAQRGLSGCFPLCASEREKGKRRPPIHKVTL
ncbi:hypothetical protein F2P81_010472 [Scophthalmus maximus]|uniref:Uncharacterized protein n=1 Tax=Scophthalmus maximus TaxID=52904 RepID=A0A6A4SZX3_SCOMX|nr:hypothetical protein F2P81_010472 [Scophthalmus maximus]